MSLNVSSKKIEKLSRKSYRDSFVESHIKIGIPHQVRAIREQRGWTQIDFSQELGKTQSTVSRLEDPAYGKFSLKTLLEVASAFDVALLVKFVPFSKLLRETSDLSPEGLGAVGFDDEVVSLKRSVEPVGELAGHSALTSDTDFIIRDDATNEEHRFQVSLRPPIQSWSKGGTHA